MDVLGAQNGEGSVVSVTDLTVDTLYSGTGYAPDLAIVPEPSSFLLSLGAGLGLIVRRRR